MIVSMSARASGNPTACAIAMAKIINKELNNCLNSLFESLNAGNYLKSNIK
jgi:hypothetical protein